MQRTMRTRTELCLGREAGKEKGGSQLRPSNDGPNMTLREGCTSASGDARFSFFLSGWKDGVPQGRHRLCHHLFQFHHWRGREGERQRRVRRFGREASADRWPGEWSFITPGPREEPSSQPSSANALPGSLPTGLAEPGPRFSPKTLLFHLHFLFRRRYSIFCHIRGS